MATYVTKKCPNCGNVYQSMQSGDQRRYGCPLLICPKCGKSFWDTDIKEPSLYGYKNAHEVYISIKAWISVAIFLCLAGVSLWFGIKSVLDYDNEGIIGIILGGVFVLIPVSYLIIQIHDAKHPESIILSQQKAYDASKERLQNTVYLTALASHDYLAKKLLEERMNGEVEHYAARPELNQLTKHSDVNKRESSRNKNPIGTTDGLSDNTLETIEKLKKLYDAGILTQEEYETKKTELLKRL